MRTSFLSLVLVVLGTCTALADDKVPSRAAEVAPLADEFTRAVVCFDLEQTNVDRFLQLVAPEEAAVLSGRAGILDGMERGRAALLEAGIDRVYFMVSLAEMPFFPWYLVAPSEHPLDVQALLAKMPGELAGPLFVHDEIVTRVIAGEDSKSWLFIGA